jgi:hypothetical protein
VMSQASFGLTVQYHWGNLRFTAVVSGAFNRALGC